MSIYSSLKIRHSGNLGPACLQPTPAHLSLLAALTTMRKPQLLLIAVATWAVLFLLLLLQTEWSTGTNLLTFGWQVLLLALCAATLGTAAYAVLLLRVSHQENKKTIQSLVRTLGHDLRGPLHSLQSAASLLGKSLNDDDRATYSSVAQDEVALLARQIDDLVRISWDQPFLWEPVSANMAEWVKHISTIYEPKAKAKGFKWVVLCEPDLPVLEVDSDRFTRCVGNLVDNAIRYSRAGKVSLELAYNELMRELIVTVTDTGPGIPKSQRAHLFEPFRGTNSRLGVGLAIVSKTALAASGHLEFQSTVGEGSIFTLTIRANPGVLPTKTISHAVDQAVAQPGSTLGAEVLLVDTDQGYLKPFAALLTDAGFAVEYVVGDPEGLSRIASAPFGVVVSCIDSDIVNGYTFTASQKKPKQRPYQIAFNSPTTSFPSAAHYALFDAVLDPSTSIEAFMDAMEKGLKRT